MKRAIRAAEEADMSQENDEQNEDQQTRGLLSREADEIAALEAK
jgi:hypothetical protein